MRQLLFLALLFPASLSAQSFFAYNGQCAKGGQNVLVQNQASHGTVPIGGSVRSLNSGAIGSYPSCMVTVFGTGTVVPATIYSNVTGQALANPFVANTDGSFLFFVAAGIYDITLTGAGLPATVTLTAVQVGSVGSGPPGPSLQLLTNNVLNGSQKTLNLANGANIVLTDNGTGTVTVAASGVILGATNNSGILQTGALLGLQPCPNGQLLQSTGPGNPWVCTSFVGGPTLQTNGILNGLQSLLNLIGGNNVSIVDNGVGGVTISVNGLTINPASQYAMPYYSAAGTSTIISGISAPTGPSGIAQLFMSTPSSGVAQIGNWGIPGIGFDEQTGTTYAIPNTDTLHFVTGSNTGATAWSGFTLANNLVFKGLNLNTGLITYTPASGKIFPGNTTVGLSTQIIPEYWFAEFATDNVNTYMPVMPTLPAFPNCPTGGLGITAATGAFVCNSFGSGSGTVSSVGLTVNGTSPSGIVTITGSPVTTSGTLNFNFAGTSGGHPYFSSATVLSSTGAGTTHGIWLAQGAGNADTTTGVGTTTTVLHGNASGDPTYAAVVGADMTNNTVTATQLAPQYSKGSCTEIWGGSGTSNAMQSGDDAIVNNGCYNDSAVTRTITALKCRSDNAGNTTVLTPTFGSAGTGTAILTGTLTCGNSYAYSATGTLNNTAWTTGTGIDPGMSTVGNATSIAMIVEFTF